MPKHQIHQTARLSLKKEVPQHTNEVAYEKYRAKYYTTIPYLNTMYSNICFCELNIESPIWYHVLQLTTFLCIYYILFCNVKF